MSASLQTTIDESSRWLIQHQDPAGGWGMMANLPPSVLNTAEALLALLDDHHSPGEQALVKAADYLEERQCREGEDAGCWMRKSASGNFDPDIVRTSFALQALVRARGAQDPAVIQGIQWLLSTRSGDQGWGFRRGEPSALMATYYALMVFLTLDWVGCNQTDETRKVIQSGMEFFVQRFRNKKDRSFGEDPEFRGVHTIHAALLLQAARRSRFGQYMDFENDAIRWLLKNQRDAKKAVEETLPINKEGDYKFIYMNDSLLLKVLASSTDDQYRNSELAHQLVNELQDKEDPEGGFPGERATSYATAKAISGLTTARETYKETPSRVTEFNPNRKLVGVVLLITIVASVALSFVDKFQVLQLIMMVAALICGMTMAGIIPPDMFERIFQRSLEIIGRYQAGPTPTK